METFSALLAFCDVVHLDTFSLLLAERWILTLNIKICHDADFATGDNECQQQSWHCDEFRFSVEISLLKRWISEYS